MDPQKEKREDQDSNSQEQEQDSFSLLKKPRVLPYDSLPTPDTQKESGVDQDEPLPGFKEFRKYKRVNETRIITPYKPELAKEQTEQSEIKPIPRIKIETPEKFLLERNVSIEVESLESLLQMINDYPTIGFVAMNRYHMDLVNDYQPYNYTICNYNDIDKANYVTISQNGLVEFYKGDADFMPLDRLLVEYELLHALHKIPLFSIYQTWKAFMVWFKKIRRRKYVEAKIKIEAFFVEKFNS